MLGASAGPQVRTEPQQELASLVPESRARCTHGSREVLRHRFLRRRRSVASSRADFVTACRLCISTRSYVAPIKRLALSPSRSRPGWTPRRVLGVSVARESGRAGRDLAFSRPRPESCSEPQKVRSHRGAASLSHGCVLRCSRARARSVCRSWLVQVVGLTGRAVVEATLARFGPLQGCHPCAQVPGPGWRKEETSAWV